MRAPLLAFALALVACAAPAPDDDDDTGPVPPGELEHRFSFAILADPHVTAPGDHLERLEATVAWIDEHADERQIELVLVVGDIAWSGGMELARDALDELDMPYVPLIGDNEVQVGEEEDYDVVFGPRFDGLADVTDGFARAPLPAWDPEREADTWLQNLTFQHRGVTFVGMDWASREGGLIGETAELHDYDGGSWPHFQEWLADLPEGPDEDVVLASHHPMHASPGAFALLEMDEIMAVTGPLADRVFGNFAGHYHFDGEEPSPDGSYEIFVTDATWDDEITIRLVEVWGNAARFEYRQELVVL